MCLCRSVLHFLRLSVLLLKISRRMVPKMLEVFAVKKKKYDEEAVKRKKKLEESRAKAKRLREKKAAATAAAAAEKAEKKAAAARAAAEQEAARKEVTQTRLLCVFERPRPAHPVFALQNIIHALSRSRRSNDLKAGIVGGGQQTSACVSIWALASVVRRGTST